jgi:hypothetical protein
VVPAALTAAAARPVTDQARQRHGDGEADHDEQYGQLGKRVHSRPLPSGVVVPPGPGVRRAGRRVAVSVKVGVRGRPGDVAGAYETEYSNYNT